MNLFRSEEDAKNWSGFKTGTEEGILPVSKLLSFLSTPRHRDKLNQHYPGVCASYVDGFVNKVHEVTKRSAFWDPVNNKPGR